MSKAICFSGHRAIPEGKKKNIYKKLLLTIKDFAEEGYTDFYAGGAVGFDMLAELAVLEMKKEYDNIKLHLILPYRGHNNYWNSADKQSFERILSLADTLEYSFDRYNKWCFAARNRRMVDLSDALVYYLSEESGGTWGTVKYAAVNDLMLVQII